MLLKIEITSFPYMEILSVIRVILANNQKMVSKDGRVRENSCEAANGSSQEFF